MKYPESDPNPLYEAFQTVKNAEPCILVIFGATGDLTARKLIPALYNLSREGQLPTHFACVGFARRDKTNDDFRTEMYEAVSKFSRSKPENQLWEDFSQKLFYHRAEFDQDEGYDTLRKLLEKLDSSFGTKGNRVFYFSTPPSYFPEISKKLSQHNLIYDITKVRDRWSRVIIEKPFGHDLASALDLQKTIDSYLDESQIFRIDHYLGKETVQNILVFRFCNSILEALWNNKYIDHVQITVAEEIGIGTRGKFFEEAGTLRDIVQNHAMQLLSLVAMEPPFDLSANAIRDEKVKVQETIRLLPLDQIPQNIIRGQYGEGLIDGMPVKGYRQEDNVSPTSSVETYVAMKLHIENWRWTGVPFYIRAGKRLPKRVTEIAITFKPIPGVLFQTTKRRHEPNVLVMRIQPDEGIALRFNSKVPGLFSSIQPVKMDFKYGSYFGVTPPEAYERLICDCMAGDSTLFARSDEVLASWKHFDPIIQYWNQTTPDFPNYESGSWGPIKAEELLNKDNRKWRLP